MTGQPGYDPAADPDSEARHGTTSLFAAFIADGTVISELHRKHRATEYLKFLRAIDKTVPAELGVHIVCDDLSTHKARHDSRPVARAGCRRAGYPAPVVDHRHERVVALERYEAVRAARRRS